MAYEDFIDLTRGTTSDKILREKIFNIAKNSKHDGYQCGFTSMVYKFFDKSLLVVALKIKNELKVYTNQV